MENLAGAEMARHFLNATPTVTVSLLPPKQLNAFMDEQLGQIAMINRVSDRMMSLWKFGSAPSPSTKLAAEPENASAEVGWLSTISTQLDTIAQVLGMQAEAVGLMTQFVANGGGGGGGGSGGGGLLGSITSTIGLVISALPLVESIGGPAASAGGAALANSATNIYTMLAAAAATLIGGALVGNRKESMERDARVQLADIATQRIHKSTSKVPALMDSKVGGRREAQTIPLVAFGDAGKALGQDVWDFCVKRFREINQITIGLTPTTDELMNQRERFRAGFSPFAFKNPFIIESPVTDPFSFPNDPLTLPSKLTSAEVPDQNYQDITLGAQGMAQSALSPIYQFQNTLVVEKMVNEMNRDELERWFETTLQQQQAGAANGRYRR